MTNKLLYIVLGTIAAIVLGGCSKTALPQLGPDDALTAFPCPSQELLSNEQFREDFKKAKGFSFYFNESEDREVMLQRGEGFLQALEHRSYRESPNSHYFRPGVTQTLGMNEEATVPQPGIYRRDGKFTANGRTYSIRVRSDIPQQQNSGKKISDLGLSEQQLQSHVVYMVNGSSHSAGPDLHEAMAENGPIVDVHATAAGMTLYDARMEVICAARM